MQFLAVLPAIVYIDRWGNISLFLSLSFVEHLTGIVAQEGNRFCEVDPFLKTLVDTILTTIQGGSVLMGMAHLLIFVLVRD